MRTDDEAYYIPDISLGQIAITGTRAECEAWVNERCAEAVVREVITIAEDDPILDDDALAALKDFLTALLGDAS